MLLHEVVLLDLVDAQALLGVDDFERVVELVQRFVRFLVTSLLWIFNKYSFVIFCLNVRKGRLSVASALLELGMYLPGCPISAASRFMAAMDLVNET